MNAIKVIDYGKAFTWLLGITLGFFAWFGKVAYEKLNSIDAKVETLLVQSGIQKNEIDHLKEDFRSMEPCRNNNNNNNKKSVSNFNKEAILPIPIEIKKLPQIALK